MEPMQPPMPPGPPGPPMPPGPPGPPLSPGPPGPPYYGQPEPPRRPGWVLPVGIGVVVGTLIGVAVWVVMSGDGDSAGDEIGGGTGTTTTTGEVSSTTVDSEPAPPDDAASLTGTWAGTYVCSQGETGMTLSIVDSAGDLEAIMEFYEVDGNPGVPSGAFAMEGTSTDGAVSLDGTEWIDQPDGYVMGGIEAEVTGSGAVQQLAGTVDSEGCTTFTLDRTTTEPWYVGTWKGGYDCGQGLTGLTLTVLDTGDDNVEATFAFYEIPENPGVPSGSYRLEGGYADHGLTLDGVEWIEQPDGYVMVGLESDFITRPSHFAGKVLDPSCTAFLLEKST